MNINNRNTALPKQHLSYGIGKCKTFNAGSYYISDECYRFGYSPMNNETDALMRLLAESSSLKFGSDIKGFKTHKEMINEMIMNTGLIETGIIWNDTYTYVVVGNFSSSYDYSLQGYNEVMKNTGSDGLLPAVQQLIDSVIISYHSGKRVEISGKVYNVLIYINRRVRI